MLRIHLQVRERPLRQWVSKRGGTSENIGIFRRFKRKRHWMCLLVENTCVEKRSVAINSL